MVRDIADFLYWIALGLMVVIVLLGFWVLRLKQHVGERERQLAAAREQLVRTQKLRALGEMLSGLAHAFNDVFTPILGRAQLLGGRVTDPQLKHWITIIERSAMEGAKTARRMQEFTRHRGPHRSVPLNLNTLVSESVDATRPRRGESIELVRELGQVKNVSGDPLALREALENLVNNAIEAMPDGGTLTVATSMDGGEAVVTVTDTGDGMTPEIQRKIFDPFFTTKENASGLGLSTAEAIVQRHGGQIEVESVPDKGSAFRVRLPLAGSAPRAQKLSGVPRPRAGAAARCLVVEDEANVRDMIKDVLTIGGHQVTLAVDGSDAADMFKTETFDIVITDLAMPRLDGLQLARIVKNLRPHTPVLLLTGWGVTLTVDELEEHGVDAVLAKPLRMDEIFAAVASLVPGPTKPEEKA
ncbi:MAG: response regulator [Candidatus Rokubacteria bacterium]|nr:response regulator [Candidatus Rokubacteria bacterium]MBI3825700.1 response regulator [Candidatus Rokubacteria bacterium]